MVVQQFENPAFIEEFANAVHGDNAEDCHHKADNKHALQKAYYKAQQTVDSADNGQRIHEIRNPSFNERQNELCRQEQHEEYD